MAVYINEMQKLKELIKLSNLCNRRELLRNHSVYWAQIFNIQSFYFISVILISIIMLTRQKM